MEPVVSGEDIKWDVGYGEGATGESPRGFNCGNGAFLYVQISGPSRRANRVRAAINMLFIRLCTGALSIALGNQKEHGTRAPTGGRRLEYTHPLLRHAVAPE